MPARKQPQDHLPPKSKKTESTPEDDRLSAILETKPTALADQFSIEDGELIFTSKRGAVIRLEMDPEMGVVEEIASKDLTGVDNLSDGMALMRLFAGDAVNRLRVSEFTPVMSRWQWELAMAFGGVTLPESGGSSTA